MQTFALCVRAQSHPPGGSPAPDAFGLFTVSGQYYLRSSIPIISLEQNESLLFGLDPGRH